MPRSKNCNILYIVNTIVQTYLTLRKYSSGELSVRFHFTCFSDNTDMQNIGLDSIN